MKAIILGSGLMGSVVARDLSRSPSVDEVAVVDASAESLERVHGISKIRAIVGDVRKAGYVTQLVKGFDVAVGALPLSIDRMVVEAVVQAEVSIVDLIFDWHHEEFTIDSLARKSGVTIVPACGFAPGLTNMLVMRGVDSLERADEVHIKAGGLPQKRELPLNYRITWSLQDVLEMYTHPAKIVRKGKPTEVEALSGLERLTLPPPIGECEAFYTDGLSSLLSTLKNVNYMAEKTIRYAGHAKEIQTLIQCGLLDKEPIEIAGAKVSPREFTARVLTPRLGTWDGRDLTLLRVEVKGIKDGKRMTERFEMIDFYDEQRKVSSMARTTAYTASIAAQMVANGEVKERGIVPSELAFRGDLFSRFIRELDTRGIKIHHAKE